MGWYKFNTTVVFSKSWFVYMFQKTIECLTIKQSWILHSNFFIQDIND